MDYQLADALNDLSGHSWLFDDLVVLMARDLIFVVFVVAAALLVPLVRRRDWGALARFGAVLALAFTFGVVAAQLYAEPRPFTSHSDIRLLVPHAAGQSFPSDHATAAFAIALAILVFVSAAWGRWLVAAAVLIGLARIYAGLHYPGDVAGSLAVALLAVAGVQLTTSALRRRTDGAPARST